MVGELTYMFIIMLAIAIFVSVYKNEKCGEVNLKVWLAVRMGAYLADFILGLG